MSIWDSVEVSQDESGNVSMETGGFFTFPDGYTDKFALVEARIEDSAEWGKKCKLKVQALAGAAKGKETNLNLNIYDQDDKKRGRAWEFAKAIDLIFGGAHVKAGADLSEMSIMKHWCNKPIVLRVGAFEMDRDDGSSSVINYLQGVWSNGAKDAAPGDIIEPKKAPQVQQQAPAPGFDAAMADDIPF